MAKDRVDAILEQWRHERPDLDTSTMGIIGRMTRLATVIGRSHEEVFARFGLDRGEFDVLATLRRSGAPHQLSPTELFRTLMMSSGGMTSRLDRLERAGLVRRVPDPRDRRSVRVELTDEGLRVVDAALEAHVTNQHRLLAGLSAEDRERLAGLMRGLLLSLEGGPEDEAG